MVSAIVGTKTGVYRLRERTPEPLGLVDQEISAVHAWRNPAGNMLILAGSYGNGLFRSDDEGATWTRISAGLTAVAFRTIVADPHTPGAMLCGTEPARLFRSHDDGLSWHELGASGRSPVAPTGICPIRRAPGRCATSSRRPTATGSLPPSRSAG